VETPSTCLGKLYTGVLVFGFTPTDYPTRLCEAIDVWFSTGFPHSSHTQVVFDLPERRDSAEMVWINTLLFHAAGPEEGVLRQWYYDY
jgi:hypothetical protein